MEKLLLGPNEIPSVLYRVQHKWYYVPPCASVNKGIYALKIDAKEPSSLNKLVAEVNNHLSLCHPPIRSFPALWISPFISVFSRREDAEESLRSRRGKPGDGMWTVFELSGEDIAAKECKVIRLSDVKGSETRLASEFLIWRYIPQEAILRSYAWTNDPSK